MLSLRLLARSRGITTGNALTRAFATAAASRPVDSLPSNLILEPSRIDPTKFAIYTPVDTTKPEAFVRPVVSLFGDTPAVEQVTLDPRVFGLPLRTDIIHDVVRWQRAKKRAGTAKAKDRSEVRGGGRKPRPQKGQGRARIGSIRAPNQRGGGVVHGPRPRSFAFSLNKKIRALGLKVALSAKLREGKLMIVDKLEAEEPKVKPFVQLLDKYKWRSVLMVDEYRDYNVKMSVRNLHRILLLPHLGANVYDIVHREKLILTVSAVELLQKRLLGANLGKPVKDEFFYELKASEAAAKKQEEEGESPQA